MGWLSKMFKKKEQPKKETVPPIIQITGQLKFADISHYEKIDFDKYEPKLLITKATEGTHYVDPTFKDLQEKCKARGLRFGAYHFFRAGSPPLVQANLFLKTVGTFDVAPILDLEVLDGASTIGCKQLAKAWLDMVETATGRVPIIYGGYSFLKDLNLDESFAKYPLWLARYSGTEPSAPAPWKEWAAWQFSENAFFKGIGECDGNVYNIKSDLFKIM